jgi:polygalacturonase
MERVLANRLRASLILTASMIASRAEAQAIVGFPDRVCSVVDSGAEGSLIWAQLVPYDTAAFQRAIDRCAAAGGGSVEVPAGEWLIGPIFLKSNIRLHLAKGAEIAGATDAALFGGEGDRIGLVNVRDASNVSIDGEGVIDGQGAVWWERMRALWRADPSFATDGQARQGFKDTRPRLVAITHSRNVRVQGVSLVNSPSFHLVMTDSDYLTVEHVRIESPAHGPNTDAIDPTQSRHIRIANNFISVGDDAVAIKSNHPDPAHPDAASSDILITGNVIHNSRGICIGSGTSGGVRSVRVENNVFVGSMYGFRIKTARGKGGEISDIVFRNNRMTDVAVPLVFTAYYEYRPMDVRAARTLLAPTGFILGNQIWPGEDDPARAFVHDQTPHVSGVLVDGLVATGADQAGIATGLPESPIEGLVLRNVKMSARTGFLVRYATVATTGTTLTATEGPSVREERGGTITPD